MSQNLTDITMKTLEALKVMELRLWALAGFAAAMQKRESLLPCFSVT